MDHSGDFIDKLSDEDIINSVFLEKDYVASTNPPVSPSGIHSSGLKPVHTTSSSPTKVFPKALSMIFRHYSSESPNRIINNSFDAYSSRVILRPRLLQCCSALGFVGVLRQGLPYSPLSMDSYNKVVHDFKREYGTYDLNEAEFISFIEHLSVLVMNQPPLNQIFGDSHSKAAAVFNWLGFHDLKSLGKSLREDSWFILGRHSVPRLVSRKTQQDTGNVRVLGVSNRLFGTSSNRTSSPNQQSTLGNGADRNVPSFMKPTASNLISTGIIDPKSIISPAKRTESLFSPLRTTGGKILSDHFPLRNEDHLPPINRLSPIKSLAGSTRNTQLYFQDSTRSLKVGDVQLPRIGAPQASPQTQILASLNPKVDKSSKYSATATTVGKDEDVYTFDENQYFTSTPYISSSSYKSRQETSRPPVPSSLPPIRATYDFNDTGDSSVFMKSQMRTNPNSFELDSSLQQRYSERLPEFNVTESSSDDVNSKPTVNVGSRSHVAQRRRSIVAEEAARTIALGHMRRLSIAASKKFVGEESDPVKDTSRNALDSPKDPEAARIAKERAALRAARELEVNRLKEEIALLEQAGNRATSGSGLLSPGGLNSIRNFTKPGSGKFGRSVGSLNLNSENGSSSVYGSRHDSGGSYRLISSVLPSRGQESSLPHSKSFFGSHP